MVSLIAVKNAVNNRGKFTVQSPGIFRRPSGVFFRRRLVIVFGDPKTFFDPPKSFSGP